MALEEERLSEDSDDEKKQEKINSKWKNILSRVNLANVAIYTDRINNNVPILSESIAKQRDSDLALTMVRRNEFNNKFLLLTGE
jgi:hypothetical protein